MLLEIPADAEALGIMLKDPAAALWQLGRRCANNENSQHHSKMYRLPVRLLWTSSRALHAVASCHGMDAIAELMPLMQ